MSAVDAFCSCEFTDSRLYRETMHTARKEHHCYECGGKIAPGERYEYVAGKCEGEFWTAKTCARCLSVVDWIRAHVPCFCRQWGGLWEEMEYYADAAGELDAPGFKFGLLRRVVKAQQARGWR